MTVMSSQEVRELAGKADLVGHEMGMMFRGPITEIVINEDPSEGNPALSIEQEFVAIYKKDRGWEQLYGRGYHVGRQDIPHFKKYDDGTIGFHIPYIGSFVIVPHDVEDPLDPKDVHFKD